MTHRCGALTTRDAVQRMVLEDVAWSAGQHEEAPDGTWEADPLAGLAQWLEGIISLYPEDERGRGNVCTF